MLNPSRNVEEHVRHFGVMRAVFHQPLHRSAAVVSPFYARRVHQMSFDKIVSAIHPNRSVNDSLFSLLVYLVVASRYRYLHTQAVPSLRRRHAPPALWRVECYQPRLRHGTGCQPWGGRSTRAVSRTGRTWHLARTNCADPPTAGCSQGGDSASFNPVALSETGATSASLQMMMAPPWPEPGESARFGLGWSIMLPEGPAV